MAQAKTEYPIDDILVNDVMTRISSYLDKTDEPQELKTDIEQLTRWNIRFM